MPFTDSRSAKPCKYGHTSGRKAQGQCRECHRLREKERYRSDPTKVLKLRASRPVAPSQTREARQIWNQNNLEKTMLHGARIRAKRDGYACTITEKDIIVPKLCPLLGTRLARTSVRRSNISPSLDKIIPEFGYMPGNVWVISWRANQLKNNASLDELRMLVDNLTKAVRERFPWEGR